MRINPPILGVAFALAMELVAAPVYAATANTPPHESTSKIKRVLLYNKIGGWQAIDGIANVKQYMTSLAQTKGFVLDTLSNDTSITIEYLKQYQVIIWNNNTNGAASVPLASARRAIVDYVDQGGGWFLIGLAGDHANSWADLTNMLGTYFSRWTTPGSATMQVDSSALIHPELRYVVQSLSHSIALSDTWMSFRNTVRGLPGVTVLYTAQGPKNVLASMEDGSGDHVYGWARTIEKGKLLYCPPGWSSNQPLAQTDSAVAKLYWNSIRWLAGDFQNGCTDPSSPLYNPDARVEDGSCQVVNLRVDANRNKTRSVQSYWRTPSVKNRQAKAVRDVRGRVVHRPEVTPQKNPHNLIPKN